MPARDYASTRFSPLDQINASMSASFRRPGCFRWEPRAAGGGAARHRGYALYHQLLSEQGFRARFDDGRTEVDLIPKPNRAAQGVACCDVVTRGLAYDDGKIFLVTLDNHVVALDAKRGREQWVTKTGDIKLGETTTAAPFVVKGNVFVGISGGEMGVRAASPPSTRRPARSTTSPIRPGPTRTCSSGRNSSRSTI